VLDVARALARRTGPPRECAWRALGAPPPPPYCCPYPCPYCTLPLLKRWRALGAVPRALALHLRFRPCPGAGGAGACGDADAAHLARVCAALLGSAGADGAPPDAPRGRGGLAEAGPSALGGVEGVVWRRPAPGAPGAAWRDGALGAGGALWGSAEELRRAPPPPLVLSGHAASLTPY
jgi:hypothetical protein